ncbi:MAG: hypothetical protein JO353_12335 [Phycisphaerae bacterium]|nr:hypothetical protein [Phycisphaerae bacterium]
MVKRRGIFLAEAMVGLVLLAGLFAMVTAAVFAQRRAADRFDADRETLIHLQRAMLALQSHQSAPADIHIRELPTPMPKTAPADWHWAELSRGHVTLIGVVPGSGKGAP